MNARTSESRYIVSNFYFFFKGSHPAAIGTALEGFVVPLWNSRALLLRCASDPKKKGLLRARLLQLRARQQYH